MSLFEWIGERFNPGEIGTVRRERNNEWQPQRKAVVWLLTVLGLLLLGLCSWWILQWDKRWQGFLGFAVYLTLSYLLRPSPAYQNMGWFGGLVDHPFRISDDVNRWLLFFALFLLPGKLILYAVQTIINTVRHQ